MAGATMVDTNALLVKDKGKGTVVLDALTALSEGSGA